MARFFKVRSERTYVSSFCSATSIADRPGLEPACASPKIPCASPCQKNLRAMRILANQEVEIGFDEVDHTQSMEFGPSRFFFKHRGYNGLPAKEGDAELGAE